MDEKLHRELINRSEAEPFGQMLGIEVVHVGLGTATVRMRVNSEFRNMFGATHGGALFSLIDEAFQLACNTHGVLFVALNVSITYVSVPVVGCMLEARATEVHKTRRTSSYLCEIRDLDNDKLIATAQALAYGTEKEISKL